MLIKIHRKWCKPNYTIGRLYINNEFICNTIEDKVRDGGNKVPGKTAIPGNGKTLNGKLAPKIYRVRITWSPKFKCYMPLVENVPCFQGIRIHWGEDENSTDGCIIVGFNTIVGKVTQSKECFRRIYSLIEQAEKLNEIVELIIYYE